MMPNVLLLIIAKPDVSLGGGRLIISSKQEAVDLVIVVAELLPRQQGVTVSDSPSIREHHTYQRMITQQRVAGENSG